MLAPTSCAFVGASQFALPSCKRFAVNTLRQDGAVPSRTLSSRSTLLCGASMQHDAANVRVTRRGIAQAAALILATGAFVLQSPLPSHAERTYNSMQKAYASYVPRIKAGITFYETDVKNAIDKADWAAVTEALGPKSKATRLAYVERYSSGVVGEVLELKGIMKIFASSITASDSESSVTLKLYQVLTKYAEFNENILAAAQAKDQDAARKAWVAGDFALRLFIDTINPQIPRSVGKIVLEGPPVVEASKDAV